MGTVSMDMLLTTSVEPGYLRATARGRFALTAANHLFLNLLDAVAQEHSERVLLDGREVTGVPRALERYLHGAFIAAAAARLSASVTPHPPKFAYVLSEPVLHHGRLGETTARNRGMSIRAFDNVDEAVAWLFAAER
jgi:hypothetical protein